MNPLTPGPSKNRTSLAKPSKSNLKQIIVNYTSVHYKFKVPLLDGRDLKLSGKFLSALLIKLTI